MSQLLQLLYRGRNFFLFLLFELISYWSVSFFNTNSYYVGKMLEANTELTDYVGLKGANKALAYENRELKEKLVLFQQNNSSPVGIYHPDSLFASRFSFQVAKVIKSTQNLTNNYITIDKGTLDGIEKGMGVISPQGIVGQVVACSEHFSRIVSTLHSRTQVSAEVVNQKLRSENIHALGIGQWNGANSRIIKLTTIDRFKPLTKGDSVITSEQNNVFPAGIMVGKIKQLKVGADNAFFDIDVELATDFSSLTYVYVVKNKLVEEQVKLEESINENQ
jgi:rod shape-determining protein MreC